MILKIFIANNSHKQDFKNLAHIFDIKENIRLIIKFKKNRLHLYLNGPNLISKLLKVTQIDFKISKFREKSLKIHKTKFVAFRSNNISYILNKCLSSPNKCIQINIQSYHLFFQEMFRIDFYLENIKETEYLHYYYISFTNPVKDIFVFLQRHGYLVATRPLEFQSKLISKLSKVASDKTIAITKPLNTQNAYFLTTKHFDITKHSIILGQTGAGKSKLIELIIRSVLKSYKDIHIIYIDPHAFLTKELKILKNSQLIDFKKTSINLFARNLDASTASELTILLFKSLLKKISDPRLDKLMKYIFYTLYKTNSMSITNISKFINDINFRKQILKMDTLDNSKLVHFFNTEFLEYYTKHYNNTVGPILNIIDQLDFINTTGSNQISLKLQDIIQTKDLILIELDRLKLGETVVKLLANLIIQQIFLLSRQQNINKHILLIIDEVSTIETTVLSSILNEARKYKLSIMLAQQFFKQVSIVLQKTILTNVYNYFIFKISRDDAVILARNLNYKIKGSQKINPKEKIMIFEEKLVQLNPREMLVRLFYKDKFYDVFKAKTLFLK